MKNYIGISRDHSGSMSNIARAAARDYNETIQGIKEAAKSENIDTIVSTVKCGVGRVNARVERESINSSVQVLKPINESQYTTDGGATPLFDSVGELINILQAAPDANDPDVAFMVMVITDGQENSSRKWSGRTIGDKIRQLQATDRWTFVFRVPRGGRQELVRLGIPEGNILEWEQTERGMKQSTVATQSAMATYYKGVKSGVKSTNTFYTDMSKVSLNEVKAALVDISKEVRLWKVTSSYGAIVREFCEYHLGMPMLKGAAFYQLTKKEDEVQDYKLIAVRHKTTGAVYAGQAARDIIGLPQYGMAKVAPGDHGNYDIFIQSTSVNRKLPTGSQVLYWPNVGTKFQEGRSAW